MVMGFASCLAGGGARDLFRVNKTEFSWEIFTPNENRYVNGTEPRCGGRKRDRRSALWQLRSEFEKAVSSQEGKKFSSVVREPPVLIIVNKNKYKQGYPREGSNKRGRLTHTSIR